MTARMRTGSNLPDLYADAVEHVEITDWLTYGALARTSQLAHMFASATVPMHVREGITPAGLSAGIFTAGTATGEEAWAGRLVAGRGCVTMLDSWRVSAEGARRHVWPRLDEPQPMVLIGRIFQALPEPAPEAPDRPSDDLSEFVARAVARQLAEQASGPFRTVSLDEEQQLREMVSAAIARFGAQRAGQPDRDPPADSPHELEELARGMSDVPAAVAIERPPVPELTDSPLENVRRLFGLTVSQLAELFGVTERQMHRYLRDGLPENRSALAAGLVAVGLTVIGGLGVQGARRWLYGGEPTGAELARRGSIAELAERAEGLRDSPVT
jgi:hypothetical protein